MALNQILFSSIKRNKTVSAANSFHWANRKEQHIFGLIKHKLFNKHYKLFYKMKLLYIMHFVWFILPQEEIRDIFLTDRKG